MKNDIRNLYWPGLYNVKLVLNCSGNMLVATSRSDKYNVTNFRVAGCHAHRKLLSKVTLGINNFSVVWIENLSNFKHFHISAMSNNRITADYEFFSELAVVTATRPSRRRYFDRFNYSPNASGSVTYRHPFVRQQL